MLFLALPNLIIELINVAALAREGQKGRFKRTLNDLNNIVGNPYVFIDWLNRVSLSFDWYVDSRNGKHLEKGHLIWDWFFLVFSLLENFFAECLCDNSFQPLWLTSWSDFSIANSYCKLFTDKFSQMLVDLHKQTNTRWYARDVFRNLCHWKWFYSKWTQKKKNFRQSLSSYLPVN